MRPAGRAPVAEHEYPALAPAAGRAGVETRKITHKTLPAPRGVGSVLLTRARVFDTSCRGRRGGRLPSKTTTTETGAGHRQVTSTAEDGGDRVVAAACSGTKFRPEARPRKSLSSLTTPADGGNPPAVMPEVAVWRAEGESVVVRYFPRELAELTAAAPAEGAITARVALYRTRVSKLTRPHGRLPHVHRGLKDPRERSAWVIDRKSVV